MRPAELATPLLREAPVPGGDIPRFEVPGWRERFGVVAGITARGASGPGFDLGLWSAQPVAEVMRRWASFRSAEPGFSAVCLGNQVHRTEVVWHDRGQGWIILDGIDGHGTDARGILLTVTVADCVPVYLVDPVRQAVAVLHAGWRGASGRILERGVRLLAGHAGSAASDVVMHCGVSICASCYEVDSQVFVAFGLPVPAGGRGRSTFERSWPGRRWRSASRISPFPRGAPRTIAAASSAIAPAAARMGAWWRTSGCPCSPDRSN